MKGFLHQLAEHFYLTYGHNIHALTIIMPSKRAGAFFLKYLKSIAREPILTPKIVTINEVVESLSSIQRVDTLTLSFHLYRIYKEITQTDESFDSFYPWGTMLISDFDDIDKYLVDAKLLFTHIEDYKAVDQKFDFLTEEQKEFLAKFWRSFSLKRRTKMQERFEKTWNTLFEVYETFRRFLHEENMGYEGILYRDIADKIHNGALEAHFPGPVFVVGLNALNRCEIVLLNYLKDYHSASFFWDIHPDYIENSEHDAAFFLRRNMKMFPQDKKFEYRPLEDKNIEIVSVPSSIGQSQPVAGFVKQTLKEYAGKRGVRFDDIAIVLCDEDLLLPTIGAIPKVANQETLVNITMGFPMKITPVNSLVSLLMDLHRNIHTDARNIRLFYHKNVQRILNHQLVQMCDTEHAVQISNKIIQENKVYLHPSELQEGDFLKMLFSFHRDVMSFNTYLLQVLQTIFSKIKAKEESFVGMQEEFIFKAYKSIKRLGELLDENQKAQNFTISLPIYFKLLKQYLSQESLPFEGDPLEGVQVMGILETRLLDFEHLVVLSMNEGAMPKTSGGNSVIPYNLRRAFELPSVEEKCAIYSYYFYRLLQQPKSVQLVYNSTTDGMNNGERSRYLYQLQMQYGYALKESTITYDVGSMENKNIVVEKDAKVMQLLSDYIEGKRTLSPSALNGYIDCPMRFYFRYVAGVNPQDEVAEEVDARLFGNIFHKVMEDLYKPWLRQEVRKEMFEQLAKNDSKLDQVILNAFRKEYFKVENATLQGRNILVFEIVKKYVKKALWVDSKQAPITILGLEVRKQKAIPIFDGKHHIMIGGTIDRVDEVDGKLRIIDYKSGSVEFNFDNIPSLFDSEDLRRNKAALQTLIYGLVYERSSSITSRPISAGIYQIQALFKEPFVSIINSKEDGEIEDIGKQTPQLVSHLTQTFEILFNPEVPFVQTECTDKCSYCDYKQICRRE
ncbi:PD-(D/E)XK nuclease family protein [Halosquirtibacter xylanolyticus]|uniref:PD-(D/E)XK nuclease family protein n=1 Tax=Halosquirtibacter xylanolyticus TaxID=3374599 RepID=UPI003748AA89|nr:PD-(D/E)XK nuclease family protein [Prolixibacteraceae bacterium]